MPTINRFNKPIRTPRDTTAGNATGAGHVADVKKADGQAGVGGVTGQPVTSTPTPSTSSSDKSRLSTDRTLGNHGVNRADVRNGVGQIFSSAANAASDVAAVSEPKIQQLYKDPDFKALYDFTMGAIAASKGREWDQLAQIKNFAAAAAFVTKGEALPGGVELKADSPLKGRFKDKQAQRAMCHLLLMMMPAGSRTEREVNFDGSRGSPQSLFSPFPDAVVARADDGFKLKKGDLPKVNPFLTDHLQGPDLLDKIFQPGQRGVFLAPKKYCPGAMIQDRKDLTAGKDKADQAGHEGDPIFVQLQDVFTDANGVKMARVTVPAQHKYRNGDDGGFHQHEQVLGQLDHVVDTQGKPVLGADGQPQPILIPVSAMADYLLDPGNVRGSGKLNLESSQDDRALALTYSNELKTNYLTDSNGYTKSLFDWLQEADGRTPRQDIERIKQGAWKAAWDAVTQHASHPRRTHFAITIDNDPTLSAAERQNRNGWKQEAMDVLKKSGLSITDSGQRYARDASHIGDRWENHQLSWTPTFLAQGFEGGTLDCYGLADAFDRLSATFLAPLGIISKADTAEGHGASVGRTLGHPDENGIIQVGSPKKVKPNELIAGFDLQKSSGVGPSAGVYWVNFGGYVKIEGSSGKRYDFAKDLAHMQKVVDGLG